MIAYLDPGKHNAAIAVADGGTLVRLYYGANVEAPRLDVDHVLAERPVIYPGTRYRTADIIDLAIGLGEALQAVSPIATRKLVPARTWKGTVPKAQMTARIRARLTPEEAAMLAALQVIKSKEHNVLDAIGLWMWSIGRLT